ncbi:radical SAM protein [Ectothiorhodospira shaposhnikovii]|uniref:arsenosugar biosynthesis radical SAM (seleno)protein ArsS n=1 Tax=Ectothiorhodospira shaposhnikovii TaxID=1054 RepID=UPI0019037A2C|nr:arsenosugar biosynthesis radical SAM (seleno)protein ArsS [Ectothiorhodospira shaposhnikovii]MBK1674072.1 radical SAM protein [Ectothiorhodospira shaposhnikovii]
MSAILQNMQSTTFPAIQRGRLEILQVNVGYVCNLICFHCHVNAGPNRREKMDRATADLVLDYLSGAGIRTLDLTGGAPELNPQFRYLVEQARGMGVHVMDRCNLTVLEQPGQGDLAAFLAAHQVEVVASLPCYTQDNVDAQRGDGVFEQSLAGLRQLNAVGYGQPGSELVLNLVYNPLGADLPPPQARLEADYKAHLAREYGIVFNGLFAITNMPIHRFAKQLRKRGQYEAYMTLLKDAYRAENLESVMCRTLLSVDWQGYAYDCDFNQMLRLPLGAGTRQRTHLRDLIHRDLEGAPITVADHCFGCTAGQGSSCGGAL